MAPELAIRPPVVVQHIPMVLRFVNQGLSLTLRAVRMRHTYSYWFARKLDSARLVNYLSGVRTCKYRIRDFQYDRTLQKFPLLVPCSFVFGRRTAGLSLRHQEALQALTPTRAKPPPPSGHSPLAGGQNHPGLRPPLRRRGISGTDSPPLGTFRTIFPSSGGVAGEA